MVSTSFIAVSYTHLADIKEGINAKAWTVGVVLGSNELGLTQESARISIAHPPVQFSSRFFHLEFHAVSISLRIDDIRLQMVVLYQLELKGDHNGKERLEK